MKINTLVSLIPFIFSLLSADVLAEPYADKLKITSNTPEMSKMTIEAANVPNRAAVGIPPYPGAKIFQTRDAGEMEVNDESFKTIAYMKLLSTDPVDKVVAWYKEQLPSYGHKDFYGVSWAFWKGEASFNSMDMTHTMTRENVLIGDATVIGYDGELKGAKSVIEVSYE
jgi:hypothetical protein